MCVGEFDDAVEKFLNREQRENNLHSSKLRSCQCTQMQLQSEVFQGWAARLHEGPMHMHRKVWEYCYITQALYERGLLAPGRRGLGFAVGQEPLPAMFASLGCEILATDLATDEAQGTGWVETNQHADSLASLNKRGLCDPESFRQRVAFRFLDMRDLPDGLGTFDFIWSACSLEHLGTIASGEKFIYQSLKYLNPGGIAIHTTEYNVHSNLATVTAGDTVVYRQQDIRRIARKLHGLGYRIDLDFSSGNMQYDNMPDEPPYQHIVSLRIRFHGYIITSFGMIMERRDHG